MDKASFFSGKQKVMAMNMSANELKKGYKKSEQMLRNVAKTGDEKALAEVMREHSNYEYALLYRNTPNFKKRRR